MDAAGSLAPLEESHEPMTVCSTVPEVADRASRREVRSAGVEPRAPPKCPVQDPQHTRQGSTVESREQARPGARAVEPRR